MGALSGLHFMRRRNSLPYADCFTVTQQWQSADYNVKIQVLEERLRNQRIEKYGKQSEKLSDLQLELLDREPAVSGEEIESEAASGPLPEGDARKSAERTPRRKNQQHPGRNELPAHLERIEEIVACAADQCRCGKCGAQTRVIGYEETEVLGMKPAVHFVRVIKREKRACAHCIEHGVATAAAPERIAPKSIFADEIIVEFIIRKYCDSVPLYRQRAILKRDLGIDVALTTINDAVLRVGELLIPMVEVMKRDLRQGAYIQADETYVEVQTPEKKGENHRAYFWQYSAPVKGVVFDFEMTRSKEVAEEFFKDYAGRTPDVASSTPSRCRTEARPPTPSWNAPSRSWMACSRSTAKRANKICRSPIAMPCGKSARRNCYRSCIRCCSVAHDQSLGRASAQIRCRQGHRLHAEALGRTDAVPEVPGNRAEHQLGGELDEADRHRAPQLAALGKQRGWTQDRSYLLDRRELPQAGRFHSKVSGGRAARPG